MAPGFVTEEWTVAGNLITLLLLQFLVPWPGSLAAPDKRVNIINSHLLILQEDCNFSTEEVQMRSQAQNNTQGNRPQGQYQQGNWPQGQGQSQYHQGNRQEYQKQQYPRQYNNQNSNQGNQYQNNYNQGYKPSYQ